MAVKKKKWRPYPLYHLMLLWWNQFKVSHVQATCVRAVSKSDSEAGIEKRNWCEIPGVQRAFPDCIPVRQPRQESLEWTRGTTQQIQKKKKKRIQRGERWGQGNTNLDAETVPAMFARPVLALVREPIVRRGIYALALVRGEELVYVRDPHRATDDLAHAGHEQVAALGEQDGLLLLLLPRLRLRL